MAPWSAGLGRLPRYSRIRPLDPVRYRMDGWELASARPGRGWCGVDSDAFDGFDLGDELLPQCGGELAVVHAVEKVLEARPAPAPDQRQRRASAPLRWPGARGLLDQSCKVGPPWTSSGTRIWRNYSGGSVSFSRKGSIHRYRWTSGCTEGDSSEWLSRPRKLDTRQDAGLIP